MTSQNEAVKKFYHMEIENDTLTPMQFVTLQRLLMFRDIIHSHFFNAPDKRGLRTVKTFRILCESGKLGHIADFIGEVLAPGCGEAREIELFDSFHLACVSKTQEEAKAFFN